MVTTPAGQFVGWQVRVGDEIAWFDAEAPHIPLAYRSGGLTWKLPPGIVATGLASEVRQEGSN
jgi:hypothetical protein